MFEFIKIETVMIILVMLAIALDVLCICATRFPEKFLIKKNYRENYKRHIYNDIKTHNYRHACFKLIQNAVPESLRQTLTNLSPKHNNELLLQGFQFMFKLIENGFLPHNTHLEAVAAVFDSLTEILNEGDDFDFEHANLTINNYQVIKIYQLRHEEFIAFRDKTNNNEFTICYNRYEQSRLSFLFEEKRYQKTSRCQRPICYW